MLNHGSRKTLWLRSLVCLTMLFIGYCGIAGLWSQNADSTHDREYKLAIWGVIQLVVNIGMIGASLPGIMLLNGICKDLTSKR